jgi:hypothetical protein
VRKGHWISGHSFASDKKKKKARTIDGILLFLRSRSRRGALLFGLRLLAIRVLLVLGLDVVAGYTPVRRSGGGLFGADALLREPALERGERVAQVIFVGEGL